MPGSQDSLLLILSEESQSGGSAKEIYKTSVMAAELPELVLRHFNYLWSFSCKTVRHSQAKRSKALASRSNYISLINSFQITLSGTPFTSEISSIRIIINVTSSTNFIKKIQPMSTTLNILNISIISKSCDALHQTLHQFLLLLHTSQLCHCCCSSGHSTRIWKATLPIFTVNGMIKKKVGCWGWMER